MESFQSATISVTATVKHRLMPYFL